MDRVVLCRVVVCPFLAFLNCDTTQFGKRIPAESTGSLLPAAVSKQVKYQVITCSTGVTRRMPKSKAAACTLQQVPGKHEREKETRKTHYGSLNLCMIRNNLVRTIEPVQSAGTTTNLL